MAFPLSYVSGKNIADALTATNAIDLNTDTSKAALFTNSVTAWDSSTAEAFGAGAWGANEVTSSGYTTGGIALTTPTVTTTAGKLVFDDTSATVVWSGVTFTTRGTLVFDSSVTNLALCAINFASDLSPVADTFTITWDATNGVFYGTFGTGS